MTDDLQTGGLTVRLRQASPIPLEVDLDCSAGELVALVGPSGSGKTTVLRIIAGVQGCAAGTIACGAQTWLAREVFVPPQQRRVGLVFQDYALFPHLSALDNVRIALGPLPASEGREQARALLRRVNLDGLEARRPDQLSGGQRQRVAIARALARRPKVLLLDEPFSAVDQVTRERLKRELVSLRKSLTIPIVLVTHDLDEAMALADRIAVLHRGRLLQCGSPDDVRLRPLSPTVARLMGQTNLFTARLSRPAVGPAPGLLEWEGMQLEIARTGPWQGGERVAWLAPADHVVLHRRGRPSAGERENPVSGVVREMSLLGEQTALTVALGEGGRSILNFKVATHAARRNEIAPGVTLTVSLLADGLHLMPAEG